MLQLLMGWVLSLEYAARRVQSGGLASALDPPAGAWPLEDAAELCQLAFRCRASRRCCKLLWFPWSTSCNGYPALEPLFCPHPLQGNSL